MADCGRRYLLPTEIPVNVLDSSHSRRLILIDVQHRGEGLLKLNKSYVAKLTFVVWEIVPDNSIRSGGFLRDRFSVDYLHSIIDSAG